MVFPAELSDALALVLANCKGANAHLTAENPGHPDDVQDVRAVQAAMASLGVSLTYGEAYNLWGLVSLDAQESWSSCSEIPEENLMSVKILCEHVANGEDYAGISQSRI
ncbi:hypothetical protein [Robbsia andropogonis]|uniref:hypothetical protein n=1 Tax=Robbsia andropogonis TaxID=28092 RepID=UPI002A6A3A23|nr:hypothetical protein [Robbsia andropogonis]